jgi:hypothetical protein
MTTAIKVKERPIILHPHELRTALDRRLSLIVRPVIPAQSVPKVPPLTMEPWIIDGIQEEDDNGLPCWSGTHPDYPTGDKWFSCPWGDIFWHLRVKEALINTPGTWVYAVDEAPVGLECDDPRVSEMLTWVHHKMSDRCPAHQMPRWASRATLEIASVGVRRVESITPGEAWAAGSERQSCARCDESGESEGQPCEDCDGEGRHSEVAVFRRYWNARHSKRPGLAWADNPFCWFVSVSQVSA